MSHPSDSFCRIRALIAALFLGCLTSIGIGCGGGGSQSEASLTPNPTPTPPQSEPPAQWVAYVKSQAQPIRSIDVADSDYSDLTFLAPVLQGRDIVELGESAHGVAEFSQTKVRLIKYLHEQLGYDVIAFESSILSTYLGNEQSGQLTAIALMQNSIFAVWSTKDVANLFSYIQSTQRTAHPLVLAGFDVQLTTPYENQVRPGIFQEVVNTVDPVYAQQVHDLDQAFIQGQNNKTYIVTNYMDLKNKYAALTSFLDANSAQIQAAYPTRPLYPLVVRQAAWGMSAYLDELDNFMLNGSQVASSYRDAGMATNLELLIDNLYPGKKIIVWAHNAHVMHDASVYSELGWRNMGNFIFQKYGNRVYTLGLYMYQGSADWNDRTLYTIPVAPDDSVEGLLHAPGGAYVFLDISSVPAWNDNTAWMYQNYRIRDWGVYDGAMTLKSQYDGLIQIDTVHPPTYIN